MMIYIHDFLEFMSHTLDGISEPLVRNLSPCARPCELIWCVCACVVLSKGDIALKQSIWNDMIQYQINAQFIRLTDGASA